METEKELSAMYPKEFWSMVRCGKGRLPATLPGQDDLKQERCNIPKANAVEFLIFCYQNPNL